MRARFVPSSRFLILAAFAAMAAPASAVSPPLEGLVTWFRAEGTAEDSAGANDGAVQNGATFEPGRVGRAFHFDGIDDYVSIPHSDSLNPDATFSVEVWMKADVPQPGPSNQQLIIDKSHGFTDGTGWALQTIPDGRLSFFIGIGGGSGSPSNFIGVESAGSVMDGEWHHVVGTYEGATFRIYVNGALSNSRPFVGTPASNTREAEIGRAWGGGAPTRHFGGLVDEASIYNRALTAAEVEGLFNAGAEGKATLVVTTSDDSSDGGDGLTSLREAMTAANASAGIPDAIAFALPAVQSPAAARFSGEGSAGETVSGEAATLENGTTFAPGVFGEAFSFDGADDQISTPHHPVQNVGTQLTLAAWINPTTNGHGRPVIQKRTAGNAGGVTFESTHSPFGIQNGFSFVLWFGGNPVSLFTPPDTIATGVWQHLAATYDGAAMRIYVNGTERASMAASGDVDDVVAPVVIGRNFTNPGFAWHGLIDEIEVYANALPPGEILSIYERGALANAAPSAGLAAEYRAEGNAIDSAGANDGTLLGAGGFAPGKIGHAFDLNASAGTRVEVASSPSLEPLNLTVSAWVNARSTGANLPPLSVGPIVLTKDFDANNISYAVTGPGDTGKFGFEARLAGSGHQIVTSANSFALNQFHHVALTWDGSALRGYVNGELEGELALAPDALAYSGGPLAIGSHSSLIGGLRAFDGLIDEVQVLGQALSAAEVRAIYEAGAAEVGLVSSIALASPLPAISDPVAIDGYTQPGASANTNPPGGGWNTALKVELDGTNAGAGADGLEILAGGGGSAIRGLAINRFPGDAILVSSSSGNAIEGNYLGSDITGMLDRGNAGRGVAIDNGISNRVLRNLISGNSSDGVRVSGSSSGQNAVQGNLIGLNGAGNADLGNDGSGVALQDLSGSTLVGGSTAAERNVISANAGDGVIVRSNSTFNMISGNYVGTDASGLEPLGNTFTGIVVFTSNNRVGGLSLGEANVVGDNGVFGIASQTGGMNTIEGNIVGLGSDGYTPVGNTGATIGGTGQGIFIENSSDNSVLRNTVGANNNGGIVIKALCMNNIVRGNWVGASVGGGSRRPNFGPGVRISGAGADNFIGGTAPGDGNLIIYNHAEGVLVEDAASVGNRILGNSIFGNDNSGIDLGPLEGVSPNDDDNNDADSGPNNLQNFPILTGLTFAGGFTVEGTLDSAPDTTYRIEFFSNLFCDDSGNGEGGLFAGAIDVTTDAQGDAEFAAELGNAFLAKRFITATATGPDGSTSEFSPCIKDNEAEPGWALYE